MHEIVPFNGTQDGTERVGNQYLAAFGMFAQGLGNDERPHKIYFFVMSRFSRVKSDANFEWTAHSLDSVMAARQFLNLQSAFERLPSAPECHHDAIPHAFRLSVASLRCGFANQGEERTPHGLSDSIIHFLPLLAPRPGVSEEIGGDSRARVHH